MDAITTEQLLREIQTVSAISRAVQRIEQRLIDIDILDLRVHLVSGLFISVFYNLASHKTSFALIQDQKRIFGADNAKIGWHLHPFSDPSRHDTCEPITFSEFLARAENHP